MKPGPLDISAINEPYFCLIQIRHQPMGVLHAVTLRPDKIKKTTRTCSMGHQHESALIMLGETPGDQAHGWQYPENMHIVAVLGRAVEKDGNWECVPVE